MKPGRRGRIEGGEYHGLTGTVVQETRMTVRVELDTPPCSWHRVVRLGHYRVREIAGEKTDD